MWLVCKWVCGWCMCEDMVGDVIVKVRFVFVWECGSVVYQGCFVKLCERIYLAYGIGFECVVHVVSV
jgi:hypothetical protein